MTSIYNAIMKAADTIERNPDLFNFMSTNAPKPECGTPGCALGWIGFHAGYKSAVAPDTMAGVAKDLLGLDMSYQFYDRMYDLKGSKQWKYSANNCAAALRLYADRYHAQKPAFTGIPDSVRQIFAELPGERVS